MIHRTEAMTAVRIEERLERTSSDFRIAAGDLREPSLAGVKAGVFGAGSGAGKRAAHVEHDDVGTQSARRSRAAVGRDTVDIDQPAAEAGERFKAPE